MTKKVGSVTGAPADGKWQAGDKLVAASKQALAQARIESVVNQGQSIPDQTTYRMLGIGDAVAYLARQRSDALIRFTAWGVSAAKAQQFADDQWRESLPELVDKHSALIYIAAVAWGMRCRIIGPVEAKMMIYLAQTQLSVFRLDVPGPLQNGSLQRNDEPPSLQLELLTPRSTPDGGDANG